MIRILRRFSLLFALLCLGGCNNDDDYEEVEVPLGYVGEAKRNPFLAAQRLCENYGRSTETSMSIAELPPRSSTLVLSSEAISSGGMAERVADWVSEGGSLVYLLEGGSKFDHQFREEFSSESDDEEEEEEEEETDFLLNFMEVTTNKSSQTDSTITFREEEFEVHFPDNTVFEVPDSWNWQGSDRVQGPVFEFTWGNGTVVFVTDAHPFRNQQIGDDDNAALFWNLVGPRQQGSVVFVLGGRLSFLALLWSRGSMVIIPILLALAIWLWKSFPRHGPTLPEETVSKRDFAQHVDALGQFLWRQQAHHRLLDPIRRRIRKRLGNALADTTTEQTPSEEGNRRWQALAERSGLSIERLREALSSDPGMEPARFVRVCRDLNTLEKSL